MLMVPAIDLLDGKVVRLTQGDYAKASFYGLDPVSVAQSFVAAGARRIHLVDLDAARAGSRAPNGLSETEKAVAAIRKAVGSTVIELGGGLRTDVDLQKMVDLGVDRFVLGTVLAKSPDLVATWASRFGPCLVGGIDARDGEVKIHGWEKGSSLSDFALARTCRGLGLISLVYTNISRDGMLSGPDTPRTLEIAEAAGLPVTISGGVSSLDDLADIHAQNHPLVGGVILGKSLYEKKIDLREAIERYQTADLPTPW